ncbi:cytochrome P450 [Mycobacterium sp. URHB0021]
MTCVSNCMSDNTEISFLDIGFTQQPHLILDRLRAAGPVSRAIMWGGVPVWLVTRYQEAKALLADPRLSKDNDKIQTLFPPNHNGAFQSSMNSNMLQSDPPDHTRLRKLVVKAFTARAVENLRGRVEEIADHLLEQIDDRGVFDLMEAFATPLPLQVISELVGIQTSNNKLFRDSVMALSDQTDRQEKDTARATLSGLLAEVIADRRKKPAGDLLSRLIEATDQGDQLSEQELMATCFVIIGAGFETTVNLIGNGVLALLHNPAQLAELRADASLLPGAVEEFLRFGSPVSTATPRFTTVPITVGDVEIPPNEFVMISLLSANHDERHFDLPAMLDIARKPQSHLAFGHGIHYCIGASLARLEASTAFERLMTRFPHMKLDNTRPVVFRDSTLIHGLEALYIRCR